MATGKRVDLHSVQEGANVSLSSMAELAAAPADLGRAWCASDAARLASAIKGHISYPQEEALRFLLACFGVGAVLGFISGLVKERHG